MKFICENNGSIIHAVRAMKWPGFAAVEVSLVTIFKGKWNKESILDKRTVKHISSYLDDTEFFENPYQLVQNSNKSFQGSIVLGKGFVLSPVKAEELIKKNKKSKDVLFPYLTGDDLNSRPDQYPSRWVINFFDWPKEKCINEYPDCFEILERLVKPERQKVKRKVRREKWWQFAERAYKLYKTIESLEKFIVINRHSKIPLFSFITNGKIFSEATVVIAIDKFSLYSILNSNIHIQWAWKQGSTIGSITLRYTPSNCFETFPFPQNLSAEMEQEMEKIGEEYHEFRRQIMLKLELGLTKTYNFFHCKDLTVDQIKKQRKKDQNTCETGFQDILKLREFHKQMDESVLRAYEWTDIELAHDFYEVDYLPENDRIRYTISPLARKEILKRLLELNHKIHEQEVKEGLAETKPGKKDNSAKEPGEHGFGPGTLFTNRKKECAVN